MFEKSWSPLDKLVPRGLHRLCGPKGFTVLLLPRNYACQRVAAKYKDEVVDFCPCRPLLLINSTIKSRFFATEMPKKSFPTMRMTRPSLKCALSFDRPMTCHCR